MQQNTINLFYSVLQKGTIVIGICKRTNNICKKIEAVFDFKEF